MYEDCAAGCYDLSMCVRSCFLFGISIYEMQFRDSDIILWACVRCSMVAKERIWILAKEF